MTQHHNGRPVAGAAVLWLAVILWLAATVFIALGAGAQPLGGGAVETLDIRPRTSTHPVTFEPVCVLDADSLEQGQGCEGALSCEAPNLGASCLPGGIDHVAAGTGLRNSGWGTVQLRGAPPHAAAVAAWLYWGVIAQSGSSPASDQVVLNGVELAGEPIEPAIEPCWADGALLRAYRVPVLDHLKTGINGDYRVYVPFSSATGGHDPWQGPPVPPPYVEGASLVVAYAHRDVPRAARFYLHDGAALLIDELQVDHVLDPPLPAARELRHTRLGADGQRQIGFTPTASFLTTLSGDQIAPKVIRGPGSTVDPNSDWQGTDGGPINQLWDTQVTRVAASPGDELEGLASYTLHYAVAPPSQGRFYYDCVAVVAHAVTAR